MSLFKELKRRNVFRVGLAYVVSAWIIAQVASLVLDSIKAPDWVMQALLLMLGLGFVVALIIAWAYELTPEGIKKEKDVVRDESVTNITAKKLDYITLAGVLVVIALFVYQQMNPTASLLNVNVTNSTVVNPDKTIISADNQTNEQSDTQPINNKSIAVLPFTNMANNADNEPFTVGLHDDLLTHLSKISALKVISRTSVMEYKDTTKKIKDIARELGVANILEGGVQRSGNQIRLNVQLIDAATDEHLWAEIYDRELTTENIFKIQTEVSKEIAKALKAQLSPAENKSIETAPTDNLEAYDAYLAARQLIAKRKSEPLKQALVLFEKASELDPNYALAYVGQATALNLLVEYSNLSLAGMLAQGEPLITKALALDPLLAEIHTIKGSYLKDQGKFVEAEASYKLSLSLNPNYPTTYHWYGNMLRNLDRYKEALALNLKGAELDPLSRVIQANIGWSLRLNNQIPEAKQQFLKISQLFPDYPGGFNGLGWVSDDEGDFAQAIIAQNKAVLLDKGNILNRSWLIGHYLNINDAQAAQAELEKAKQIAPQHALNGFIEFQINLVASDYSATTQFMTNVLESNPDNNFIKNVLAMIAVINGECKSSIELWQSSIPEMFSEDYAITNNSVYEVIDLSWCLKQTGQESQATKHLVKLQYYVDNLTYDNSWRLFSRVGLLALQDKPKEAAQAFADRVASKRVRNWFWVDHLPYFADTRKEPVFIKARKQLMLELAYQRELLKQYQTDGHIQ